MCLPKTLNPTAHGYYVESTGACANLCLLWNVLTIWLTPVIWQDAGGVLEVLAGTSDSDWDRGAEKVVCMSRVVVGG